MAVFYVYVQKTEGVIAEEHVLYVEYATMCLTLPFLSLYLEPNDWGAVLHYGALEWGNLLFSSLGVSARSMAYRDRVALEQHCGASLHVRLACKEQSLCLGPCRSSGREVLMLPP